MMPAGVCQRGRRRGVGYASRVAGLKAVELPD